MPRARVLVVDDSAVTRRLLARVIDEDPLLEVVATAPNGRIALEKVERYAPDLVTLDVEMPDVDGIETLRRLRAVHRSLPVVMCSSLTERGASVTLEALMGGADDYVTKPTGAAGVDAAMGQLGADLLPKIKALCGLGGGGAGVRRRTTVPSQVPLPAARPRASAVVVGVSTGGPNALADLCAHLPADLPVPVLIVQHMPPTFTRLLAERLDERCPLPVREAYGGAPAAPGTVWVAAGDHHLTVRRRGAAVELALDQGPPENSCRPSVDVLFRSAASVWGGDALGVVLTGMGHDGLRGAERLAERGGAVIVQDEASSVVWGMPGAVVRAGLADEVVGLPDMAGAIVCRVSAAVRKEVVR